MIETTQDINKKVSNSRVAYFSLNISFMAIIMAIFIYSAFYKFNSHRIPALLTQETGIVPPSKGLSASFAEIVRGNISVALELNPHSIRIFSFFVLQFLFRAVILFSLKKQWFPINRMVTIDVSISVILFVVCFAPLIEFTLKLFAQLLH